MQKEEEEGDDERVYSLSLLLFIYLFSYLKTIS